MPRDSNGIYTLPAGNPVISGAIIESNWANTTMPDIGNEISDSLSRNGEGGMLAPFRKIPGTAALPADTWTAEPTSGWYRAGAGDFRYSIAATDVFRIIPGAVEVWDGSSWNSITPGAFLETDGTNFMTGILRVDTANGDHARLGHARVISGTSQTILAYSTDGTGATQGVYGAQLLLEPTQARLQSSPTSATYLQLDSSTVNLGNQTTGPFLQLGGSPYFVYQFDGDDRITADAETLNLYTTATDGDNKISFFESGGVRVADFGYDDAENTVQLDILNGLLFEIEMGGLQAFRCEPDTGNDGADIPGMVARIAKIMPLLPITPSPSPTATGTDHLFQVGQEAQNNLRISNNQILAASNGVRAVLTLAGSQVVVQDDGTSVARSLAAASGGLEVNNTLTGAGFERVLTTSDIGGSYVTTNTAQSITATKTFTARQAIQIGTAGTPPTLRLGADNGGTTITNNVTKAFSVSAPPYASGTDDDRFIFSYLHDSTLANLRIGGISNDTDFTVDNVDLYCTNQIRLSVNLGGGSFSTARLREEDFEVNVPIWLDNFTVATAPSPAEPGYLGYCSNGNSGSPCLAVYDGTSWKRVPLGATIST